MFAVIALACAVDIVVVFPAKAVVLLVPICNNEVLPSKALPAVVPKPGKVTLELLVVISVACCEVIPVLAVFATIASA